MNIHNPRPKLLTRSLLGLLAFGFIASWTLVFASPTVLAVDAITLKQAKEVCLRKEKPQACLDLLKECPKVAATAKSKCYREKVKEGVGAGTASNDEISIDAGASSADTCGSGENAVKTQINFGCTGKGNPIQDMAYALIRFLSYGVGLVLAASIIYAGFQYTSSTGNPEATAEAKDRIRNAMIALVLYLLAFALIQYLVPGGLFYTS